MSILSLSPLSFLCHLFLIIILFTSQTNADKNAKKFHYFCDQINDRGNYITDSTYQDNLILALVSLFNSKIEYGFYNASYGQNDDQVNAIGICRGDNTNPKDCPFCLIQSIINLTQACPNKKEAIGWYEDEKCMLRYSDRSILGLNEIEPAYFEWKSNNATLADQFNIVVKQLLNDLRSKVINGDSHRKYVVGTLPGPSSNQIIYGLVQCTPDLSGPQCDDCLLQSIAEVSRCCSNRIGARIVRPSCNLRFETSYQFYQPKAKPASHLP